MKIRFFKKRVLSRTYPIAAPVVEKQEEKEAKDTQQEEKEEEKPQKQKNKPNKKQETMTENEKIEKAEELVSALKPETKVIKRDKGLIERTESSKIILTEDNKQVLND